jgi:hypothetical protein
LNVRLLPKKAIPYLSVEGEPIIYCLRMRVKKHILPPEEAEEPKKAFGPALKLSDLQ